MRRRSTMSSVRVGRQGWGGAYERIDPQRGVVAVLPCTGREATCAGALCAALHRHELSTLCLEAGNEAEFSAQSLQSALEWLHQVSGGAPLGVFGGGLGVAAALEAAAARPARAAAMVLHGTLPDALLDSLPRVLAATLLVVGDGDATQLQAHRRALPMLGGARRLEVVPGAGTDAADAAASQAVADLAAQWFAQQLSPRRLH